MRSLAVSNACTPSKFINNCNYRVHDETSLVWVWHTFGCCLSINPFWTMLAWFGGVYVVCAGDGWESPVVRVGNGVVLMSVHPLMHWSHGLSGMESGSSGSSARDVIKRLLHPPSSIASRAEPSSLAARFLERCSVDFRLIRDGVCLVNG